MGDPSTSESKPVQHARRESSAPADSAVVSRSQGRPSAAQGQSGEPGEALRWGVERRLAYLEQRLYWDGSVSRQALIDRFGISVNQASADFARYMEMAPGNMAYDGRAKRYRPTDDFAMRFGAPDAARFLAEVRARAEGLIEDAAASIPDPPAAEVVPLPVRAVDPAVLREVVRAIERGRGIAVTYRSFSTLGARRRVIEPHALVFDGTRWHARAGDPEKGDFRDFALGRMTEAVAVGPARLDRGADSDWLAHVTLVLGPHPALTPDQAEAVRLDYGFEGAELRLTVRRALAFYVKRRLRLDIDWRSVPATTQHIRLVAEEPAALGTDDTDLSRR